MTTPSIAPASPLPAGENTPRPRGRPQLYRDASQKKEGARLRKQRQRERERDAGMTTIDLRLPTDLLASLTHAAAFTLTDPQALAAFLVKGALGPYRREIDALAARAGVAWLKASPFIRYAAFLEKPGSAFRVHDRTIRHEDWKPIVDEIGAIKAALGRYGWPRDRIDRFIRRAGEHAQLDATRAAKNKSK